MKIVVAVDSFKGSLSSMEAGRAIREGIQKATPLANVIVRPLADGGEGTTDALIEGLGGERIELTVTGPLGEPVCACYGYLKETHTAIIEMASAAGITLIPRDKRNPMAATTYGVGELIKDAAEKGCRNFIIGIGGSATNDGGVGMLQALGYDFLDEEGKQVPYGARGLELLKTVSGENVLPELADCQFYIACDVTNKLCGDLGCSAVYGPQKGADPEMIRQMDRWLERYALLARQSFPKADPNQPGTGAAGGLGFAFLSFTNAVLESGIKLVLEETRLADYIKDADIVITGEGRMDAQTAMGKAPEGVARLAKTFGKPVLAFAGAVTRDAAACNSAGIDAFSPFSLRCVFRGGHGSGNGRIQYGGYGGAGVSGDPGGRVCGMRLKSP